MKLSILERLILLGTLPREGNFTTIKIIRKLRETLSFSEEEHKKLQFKDDNDRLTWAMDFEKDVVIGEKATDTIIESLKKLDEQKKLTEEHFSLYEKFVAKEN